MSTGAIIGIVIGVGVGGVCVVGILASMLLPTLAKAKGKANRLKCANNLSQITKSFHSFSGDHGTFPWQLPDDDKEALFGGADLKHLGTIFAIPEVKWDYGNMKSLLSPCDPERKEANTKANESFESYDARNPVPHGAISYGICLGADDQAPETILGITRNVSGDDLKGAEFLGNVMAGLESNQGQMSLSDGSVRQADDTELAASVTAHTESVGGFAPGQPSTKLMLPK